ncbi:MAG: hypothetical protein ACK502_07470 [Alphaproteobacteria bacterium]
MVDGTEHLFASAMERRLTLRLLAYWEKIRSGRIMPSESDFKADDIAEFWESCFLLHPARFNDVSYCHSHLGSQLAAAGKNEAELLISPQNPDVLPIYTVLMADFKPITSEGEITSQTGKLVQFRRCFLPLGHNDTVTAIVGGLRFKVF